MRSVPLMRWLLPLIASFMILLYSSEAIAAQKVGLNYKIFHGSISVRELTTLAQTGKTSLLLGLYLKAAKQDAQTVRNILTKEVTVSPVILERTLNNPAGGLLLDRIGQAIHPPSGQANREALRSALVLSAREDNKVSPIEILQNYPTSEVQIEGDRLVAVARLAEQLQNQLGDRKLF